MSVSGYIPYPLRKEAQNVGFKHEYRNGQATDTLFEFRFNFQLPKKRKDRQIIERDQMGRIVSSRAEEYPEYALFSEK